MVSKRFWRWLLVTLAVLLAVAVSAVGIVYTRDRAASLTRDRAASLLLCSRPSEATVFDESGRKIGITPLRMRLEAGERIILRLVRRNCRDKEIVVEADKLIPPGAWAPVRNIFKEDEVERTVVLAPVAGARLAVSTDPAGAEVFLDGVRLGIAPLRHKNLSPGTHTLRLVKAEYFGERESLVLEADKETSVHTVLRSKVVVLYRDLIKKQPKLMTHYTELAHHYVLAGKFKAAEEVLREGLAALAKGGTTLSSRYFQELGNIYIRQFHYPEETEENKIRPAIRSLVQEALAKNIGAKKTLQRLIQQFDRHDKTHRR